MATIEERTGRNGRKRYRAHIRLKGHSPLSATFDRKTDAALWVQQTEADIRRGRHLQVVEAKRRTFGEMIDRCIQGVLAEKSLRAQQVQTPQLLWWKERLGAHLLADVTPSRIAEARDGLARGRVRSGQRRSPSTVVRYVAALSHCFSIAVKEWQ